MKDAQVSKREGRGEKRKENKDEGPSQKPKTDFKDKKPAWQREYICWEKARGTGPYQKYETNKDKNGKNPSPESPVKEMPRKAEISDPSRKDVKRMIIGGPVGGDSQRASNAQIREAYGTSIKEVMDVEPADDTPLIQFGQEEQHGLKTQGNDALVITALLANYEIGRVFIDSGSSTDILFGEAYDQMQLGDVPVETVDTSLNGFAGEVVHPRGMISLPLTLVTVPLRKTCLLKFLLDIPSAYNVILGRPTLNIFRAIISTYHMKIKFPVIGGVVEAQADTLQAGKCYVEAIKRGKKRGVEETSGEENPNKWGKDPIPNQEPKEDAPITVQPVEELLTIELIPGDPEKNKQHFGPEKDKIIQEEVNKLLATGHIREIQFLEWFSHVVLIPKPDGKWRMCIDFRNLNKTCPKYFYPLPKIDQLVDSTFECERLSMMDASQGYHQIMLAPEDHKRVNFITSDGTF
ncbi:UNVERIFIED_CONTAM: Transposon Ty3-G Gag-Pol polyprotein [Sesamum latifolium]|uniref:Transposon Ty3-G Gag-Pol polyprotein n=1 Tax=Sesamum latifolium TaxID=2727402 RepID=A0AAW2Y049_9LAMI